VNVEIVAVGTELLLGQILDTNSMRIAGELARAGLGCHFQTRVGDNIDRIVAVLRAACERSDAVIICGGLGPTQDDVTREALARLLGVALYRDEEQLAVLTALFAERGREMAASNARQADVPAGAEVIPQRRGTAPGLIVQHGSTTLYALPGVPHELDEMLARAVLPDLGATARRRGETGVIASRTLRTWGISESRLSEIVAPRIEALGTEGIGVPTIAFLASGIEGIKIRITVKAVDEARAGAALTAEETELRALLGEAVFGADDVTMEAAVGELLTARGWRLGCAESLTGGLLASRLVAVPGASAWFLGSIVSYATAWKQEFLGVRDGPVIEARAAAEMASGVARRGGSEVGLATTGVAGPTPAEGQPVGTVFVGLALPGEEPAAIKLTIAGEREHVRQIATISALDHLRRRLLGLAPPARPRAS
jgi:nicotinamide-nucleotide amidase